MPDVLGLAAFGLGDSCAGGKTIPDTAFLPASVILPGSWRGAILAGQAASESRLETGLMWPPEARIDDKTVLRHVPVSLLWSKLVQDGDKLSYWMPGGGKARCSTAAALYAHLADLLQQAGWEHQEVVIAIPNMLDEMGQEELLRAFGERREHVQLVWRPVAAAMQWLHGLGAGFRIRSGDWMLVIYMGPDLFEVTAFDLQQDEKTGYPVPVRRSRKGKGTALTGMDWAWSCCSGDSVGEIWQQVMRFPEVWESLTRHGGTHGSQRIWSRKDGVWDTWELERNLHSWQRVKAKGSTWLSTQTGRKKTQEQGDRSWHDFFFTAVQAAREGRDGRLRGVVMCGSLIPEKRPSWFNIQSCAGTMQIFRKPAPDTIWLPARTDADAVAKGAKLYGERLRDNLPTYLDTLPKLEILTEDRRRHMVWKSLVGEATCKGGQEYTNLVHGFFYQKHHSSLKALLRKGHEDTDRHATDVNKNRKALLQKENETAYREEKVPLPFVPVKNIPIEIHVRMKPASGLAQVRLVTCDNSIEDLLFDFSRMQEVFTLPKEKLFCPEDGHIDLSAGISLQDQWAFKRDCSDFVRAPKAGSSFSYYEKVRKKWLLPSRPLKLIDENGNTQREFEELLEAVVAQLVRIGNLPGTGLSHIIRQVSFLWEKTPLPFKKFLVDTLHKRLWAKNYGTSTGHRDLVEAAGRCFHTEEECRLLFRYIVRLHLTFAYALAAAFNLLQYRPEAWKALDDETAYGLLRIALEMMEAQRKDKKVKFRNAASLIFVLLKYRLKNGHMEFLSKEDKNVNVRERLSMYIKEVEMELSSTAKIYQMAARTKANLEQSRTYLRSIFDYIDYKGDPSTVPLLEEDG